MTDGQLAKVVTRLYRLNEDIRYLLYEELINHPNGESLLGELHENGFGISYDLASIAHSHLTYPERWEYVDGGTLRWKAKRRAAELGFDVAAEAKGGK